MGFRKYIISLLYFPFRLLTLFSNTFNTNSFRLRIILMHDIPKDSHQNFKKKIEYISKRWKFISVQELEDHFEGKKNLNGDSVLLTFDDGFHSNKVIAEEILNPLGIKALFFVVTNFVSLKKQSDQIKFIKSNLYPDWRGHAYPKNIDDMKSLSYADLKDLVSSGHTIGCHTSNHLDLSVVNDADSLEEEIIQSRTELEEKIGVTVERFSFGFGNVAFFSKEALKVSKEKFKYIYTGMRGDNFNIDLPWALRRDTISLDDSNLQIGSFLEGSADYRYKKDLQKYESWVADD